MLENITCVVIFITAFSTTKKPTKNRKKTELNRDNTTSVEGNQQEMNELQCQLAVHQA